MNILYLSHERKMGGANRALYELALAMKKNGHNVSVAVLFSGCPIDVELKKQGIKTVPCFYGWWMEPANWPAYMKWAFRMLHSFQWLAVKQLSQYVMKNDIDIIHSNSSTIDIGIYIRKNVAKLGKQVKHVWHIREYGDVDYQLEFMKSRKAAIQDINDGADRVICISKALREHYQDIQNVDVIYDGLMYTDGLIAEKKENSSIQVDEVKQLNEKQSLEAKMGMIVAPVDLGAQNNCSASNTIKMCESIANKVPDRHISFVLAGNLIPGKNQHAAVKAAHILKQRGITNFVILLAGASTDLKESKKYEAMLIKEIEKYNLQDQVKLCGFIKNMHEFRQDADCEIVASKSEAYGRVTIEAMLAGNLVIASTSGSGPELLGDINPNFPNNPNWRQRGILFSQEASMSDDEIATNLADSMIQVIHTMNDANANKKILQIIDKAMAYVFAEHRTEIAVDKVEALYSVQ